MYGKLMSVPDKLMVRYYELLTTATAEEIAAVKSGAMHPMEAKKRLARAIVTEYHGAPAAIAPRNTSRASISAGKFPPARRSIESPRISGFAS